LLLVNELNQANKDFDLLMLPNRNHNFGNEPYMVRRTLDYFVKNLLGAEPPHRISNEAAGQWPALARAVLKNGSSGCQSSGSVDVFPLCRSIFVVSARFSRRRPFPFLAAMSAPVFLLRSFSSLTRWRTPDSTSVLKL